MQQRSNFWKIDSDDDFDDYYVREHRYYWTPSTYWAKYVLQRNKLSVDHLNTLKEFARFFYYQMVDDKSYVTTKYKDHSKLKGTDLLNAQVKESFYSDLWYKLIPGSTPTDQAVNLIILLERAKEQNRSTVQSIKQENQEKEQKAKMEDKEKKEEEKPKKEKPEKKEESQDQEGDDGEKEEGDGKPQDEGDQDGEPKDGEGEGESDEDGEDGDDAKDCKNPKPKSQVEKDAEEKAREFMRIPLEFVTEQLPKESFDSSTINMLMNQRENMSSFKDKLEMMDKIAMIEGFGKSFEIKKHVSEKKVCNSFEHKQKKMVEFDEIVSSPMYQRLFPHFKQKFATKDLIVNIPVIHEESKQKIIILADFSGSMSSPEKQQWMLALLADRLNYCMKEECEIFFSFFLNRLIGKFHHIYNKETAEQFFKTFNTHPSGGDTAIGEVIEQVRKEIMNNKKLFNIDVDLSVEQPEILVINDGQDTVKTSQFNWKTNAITLYGVNSQLRDLCERTKGTYVSVDHHTMKRK